MKETQAKQVASSLVLWSLELNKCLKFYFHQIKKYLKIYFILLAIKKKISKDICLLFKGIQNMKGKNMSLM